MKPRVDKGKEKGNTKVLHVITIMCKYNVGALLHLLVMTS